MAKKLWGGRFDKKTNPLVEEFTKSIDYDYKLAKYDVEGSLIHVNILEKVGYLSNDEARKLHGALSGIHAQIEKRKFKFDDRCEDIHTNIQNAVERKVGDLALKLHTARSRNDQVIFDLKLFCKTKIFDILKLCNDLKKSLNEAEKTNRRSIIPGYTHLQHAQLVYLSDYLGSYREMLKRDTERLNNIEKNIHLTLGAGAVAGTPIPSKLYHEEVKEFIKDRKIGATIEPATNALDAVSNRDFVIEILSALSILGMHLSRISEDLIILSTKEFGFVEIDEAFATGSSLMPQKKNPDVLELIRGHTGALYGNLVSVLTMMKGLPLSYNRDMQLDKPPLFSSFQIIEIELKVLAKLIKTLKWNKDAIKKRIEEDESLYATDLVYYLGEKGIPFTKAHEIIGRLVKFSLDNSKKIRKMKDKELKRFSDKLKHNEIIKLMDPIVSVKSRKSIARTKKS